MKKKIYIYATICCLFIGLLCVEGCGKKETQEPQEHVAQETIVIDNSFDTDTQPEVISVQPETFTEENNGVLDMTFDNENVEAEEVADENGEENSEKTEGSDENNETDSDDLKDESEKILNENVDDDSDENGSEIAVMIEEVSLNPEWKYADFSKINSGKAILYRAALNRKSVVIGVNAGHGTKGGQSVKTYCHPDKSPKVTGGSTAAGSDTATAVSGGMTFFDGTTEASVTLKTAQIFRDKLLKAGYDVLMLRDGDDVQLDNIARTVIGNNVADCIISIHWDGDNLDYDKGCFYIATPEGTKGMEPVASHWKQHEELGKALIDGLKSKECKIYEGIPVVIDLTQTSFSTVASIDIELGNAASKHDDETLTKLADGLLAGIKKVY